MIKQTCKYSLPVLISLLLALPATAEDVEHGWNSPALIKRKVVETFDGVDTYQAKFTIETQSGYKKKSMSGRCMYKKGGKMRFDFKDPSGDLIVSDGKTLWIYVARLNAVGIQSLELDKKRDNRPVFTAVNGPGLKRLFRKYHFRFDDIKQPRFVGEKKYFILDLTQKVKIGGFSKIKLYIDHKNYFIRKAEASNDFGLTSTISFSDIKTNAEIEDGVFRYNVPGSVKHQVRNPLVNE